MGHGGPARTQVGHRLRQRVDERVWTEKLLDLSPTEQQHLDRLGEAVRQVDVLLPGHGAVAEGAEVAARLANDRAYIDALRRGEEPVDARLEASDWLSGPRRSDTGAGRPGWLTAMRVCRASTQLPGSR